MSVVHHSGVGIASCCGTRWSPQGFTVYESEWWHLYYKDWRAYRIENRTFEEVLGSR
jgi:hypothetical protein